MQPQPFAPAPPARPPLKPAGWWFAVGAALIVVGVVAGGALVISAIVGYIDKIDEDFQRVDVPGSGNVTLDTGGYTVYHEYSGASNELFGPELEVSITAPDGSDVPLSDYDSDVTYDSGDHEGVALFSFDAPVAGSYQVTTSGSPRGTVAVGRGLGSGLVGPIVAGVLVGFVGVVSGIVVLIVVGVRRGRNRRHQMQGQAPPPGWGGYGPPGAPGAPGAPPPGTAYPPSPPPGTAYPPSPPPGSSGTTF